MFAASYLEIFLSVLAAQIPLVGCVSFFLSSNKKDSGVLTFTFYLNERRFGTLPATVFFFFFLNNIYLSNDQLSAFYCQESGKLRKAELEFKGETQVTHGAERELGMRRIKLQRARQTRPQV